MLEGLTYVEAVLWIGGRLAEGLAHAHERGVLHRDLKPANVLLTDEGQPMLLDFNLSEDVQAAGAAGARVGGTLPYMAPEHLTAYQGRPAVVDARSDLYSLGVVLYELLTGRCPFEKHGGPLESVLPKMIADRLRPPPPARSLNPGATPAVDSILRRCLESDPARRYQSARELQEDLDRQRLYQPLRYAADPSPRERVAKWLKRNPRAVSASRVGTAAVVLLALLTAGLFCRGEQVAKYEAAARLSGFRDDLGTARLLLGARAADVDQLGEGREAARRALDRYRADADDRWREQASVRRLPEEEKDRLQAEVGELLVLLAAPAARPDGRTADDPKRRDDLDEALRMNRLAEKCYPEGQAPRALWAQRARLEALLGHDDEARRQRERADATPVRDDWDEYLLAREQAGRGRLADAAERLRAVAVKEPANFAVQFLMGNCCLDGFIDRLGQETDAVGCYSACIALRPDFHAAYANRGRVRLRRDQYAEAEADLTRAMELRPDQAEYYRGPRPGARRPGPRAGRPGRPRPGGGTRLDGRDALLPADAGAPAAGPRHVRPARPGSPPPADADRREGFRGARPGPRGGRRHEGGAGRLHAGGGIECQFRAGLAGPGGGVGGAVGPQPRGAGAVGPTVGVVPGVRPVRAPGRGAGAAGDARRGRGRRPKALELNPGSGEALYHAASVYALSARPRGRPDGGVPAFVPGAAKGTGLGRAAQDDDLAALRTDPRFNDLKRTAGLLQTGGR